MKVCLWLNWTCKHLRKKTHHFTLATMQDLSGNVWFMNLNYNWIWYINVRIFSSNLCDRLCDIKMIGTLSQVSFLEKSISCNAILFMLNKGPVTLERRKKISCRFWYSVLSSVGYWKRLRLASPAVSLLHLTTLQLLQRSWVNALTFNLAGACIGRDSHTRNDVISRLV